MEGKPALKALFFLVIGILCGRYLNPPLTVTLVTISIVVPLSAFLWLKKRWGVVLNILLCGGLFLGGILRYQVSAHYFASNHISNFTGFKEHVTVEGHIVRDPDIRTNKIVLTLESDRIYHSGNWLKTCGKILVNLRGIQKKIEYGYKIRIQGRLLRPSGERNPGEFNYRGYLQAQGVFGIINVYKSKNIEVLSKSEGNWFLKGIIYPLKGYISSVVNRTIDGQEGALLKGLLVGERGEMPFEIREAFAKTGVIHVLAVSGLHVGFVLLIFMALFGLLRIPYAGRVLLTLFALFIYAFITDLRPPVVRASIMAGTILVATLLERRTDIYNTLALAALILLLLNPLDIFQVGFQLSFAAVLSIVCLYYGLKESLFKWTSAARLKDSFIQRHVITLFTVSLAAQLGTLPLTVYYFNRIPIISLVANLIVVPAVGVIVALGFATSLFGALLWPLAQIYANANWLFLTGLIKLVTWMSSLPFAYLTYPRPAVSHLAVYYIGLGFVVNFKKRVSRRWFLIFVLVLLNLVIWSGNFQGHRWLTVTFFDVGQGDAALVSFPEGENLLIDGGEKKPTFDAGERIIAPYLRRKGIKKIDAIILSHPHSDHVGGFPYIIENFKVGQVIDGGQYIESEVYHEYVGLVDSLNLSYRRARAGDLIEDFGDAKLLVLHPTDEFVDPEGNESQQVNNSSVVVKVVYGERSFLFTGDIEREAEQALLRYGDFLRSDVLKASHHGSITSNTPKFLKEVKPQYAVISVGEFNPFNLPSDIILRRLKILGAKIARTDQDGAVIFKTDGKKLKRVR